MLSIISTFTTKYATLVFTLVSANLDAHRNRLFLHDVCDSASGDVVSALQEQLRERILPCPEEMRSVEFATCLLQVARELCGRGWEAEAEVEVEMEGREQHNATTSSCSWCNHKTNSREHTFKSEAEHVRHLVEHVHNDDLQFANAMASSSFSMWNQGNFSFLEGVDEITVAVRPETAPSCRPRLEEELLRWAFEKGHASHIMPKYDPTICQREEYDPMLDRSNGFFQLFINWSNSKLRIKFTNLKKSADCPQRADSDACGTTIQVPILSR